MSRADRTDVVIVGAGHVGLTLLTDLVSTSELHGMHPTVLFARDGLDGDDRRVRALGAITRTNLMNGERDTVELGEQHFGGLHDERSDDRFDSAQHIVVAVPDIPVLRLELMDRIARIASLPGKVLTFVRAGQGGQPVLAEWVRRTPRLRDTSVVLVEDSFYGTRADGLHIAYKRKLSVNVSVYSRTSEQTVERLRALFPLGHLVGRPSWPDIVVRPGIGLLFDPLGYIIHVGVALDARNLAKTAAGVRYQHYTDGVDRRLAVRLDALDQERMALASAYGVAAETFPRIIERQYGIPYRSDFYEMMQSCRDIYRSMSCGSIDELRQSRIVREDLPGLRTIRWLADAAGVRLPATDDFEVDVLRTARELGVAGGDVIGYAPELATIPEDVAHIRSLLTDPHGVVGAAAGVGPNADVGAR